MYTYNNLQYISIHRPEELYGFFFFLRLGVINGHMLIAIILITQLAANGIGCASFVHYIFHYYDYYILLLSSTSSL